MDCALELSTVLHLIEEYIIVLSPYGNVIFFNKPALSLYCLEHNAVIEAFFPDFMKKNDLPSPLPETFKFPYDDAIEVEEIEISFNNGIQKNVLWKVTPYKIDKNQILILLIGKDVTKIRQAEEKIFELDSIIGQTPGNLYWFSKDNIYLGCNDHSAKLLGMSRKEAAGQDFRYLMSTLSTPDPSLVETFIAQGQEVIETGKPLLNIEEPPFAGADNKLKYYVANKVPLRNKHGEIYGVIGISTDITHRKELEENLRIQKEKALIASKSKSEFIANMSHDLRTPITGMLGMIQDMLNTADQAKVSLNEENVFKDTQTLKNVIETITRDGNYLMGATDELLQLCNEILEVVRLESGKLENNVEAFNLQELVQHNIELLQPVAHHKKLQLSYKIGKNIPCHLSGARIYLDRILLNLLSNALKFTEEGQVKISVKLLDNSDLALKIKDKIRLKILVKDTGVGIPKDKFDTIFEHFSRLSPTYEGLYKGAGLGLYTVKRYVQAMKGKIWLESELGKGTCFTVTLPFFVSDHSDRVKASVRLTKPIKPLPDQTMLEKEESVSVESIAPSILVVEDNTLAAIAVKLALKPFNCHIDIAENGAKAVAMAKISEYDLILMDVGLPDFSGIEATKKIRSFSEIEKSRVPIVALTGHAGNPEMRQEAIEAGMQDVLSKPAQPLALESIFKNYVFTEIKKQASQETTIPEEHVSSTSLPVIDWKACVHMCGGDPKFTRELLSILDNDLKKTKAVITEAYSKRDVDALRAELHRSRGGVCYLKLPELEETLKNFHEAIKEVPQDLLRLEKTYAELNQAIDNFKIAWENDFN